MNAHQRADITIIGAGIMGASIAFQLSRQTNAKILLIDQFQPVGGMSGRTFGQIRQHYSNELMVQLSIRGFDVFQNWSREVGTGDPGYIRMGYLLLVIEKQMEVLRRNVLIGQQQGVATSVVDPEEIKRIEPGLKTDDLAGGAYEPNGGYIDVTRMLLSWLCAAQSRGVQLMAGHRVQAIETRNGQVSAVRTADTTIATSLVINATGAWGCDLLSPLDIEVPIERRRLDMSYMRQTIKQPQIGTCITDGNSNVVIRPDMGRDFLAVAYPPEIPLVCNPLAPAPEQHRSQHLMRLEKAFNERLPYCTGASEIRHVSGAYDITPDFHPVLGWAPNVQNLYLAIGFSGHGLKLSPAIGEVVADTVLGKEPEFDVRPLRLERFAENDLMYLAYGPISARA